MKEVIKTLLVYSVLVVLVDSVYLSGLQSIWSNDKEDSGAPMKMKLPACIVVYLALVLVWYVFITLISKNLHLGKILFVP